MLRMEWGLIIGRNVRRYRKGKRMSQERLALSADIDLRYLGGIERGEHNPTVAVLVRLAEALNVHPRDFFNESKSDTPAPPESD